MNSSFACWKLKKLRKLSDLRSRKLKDNTFATGYTSLQIIRPLTSYNFRREAA